MLQGGACECGLNGMYAICEQGVGGVDLLLNIWELMFASVCGRRRHCGTRSRTPLQRDDVAGVENRPHEADGDARVDRIFRMHWCTEPIGIHLSHACSIRVGGGADTFRD